MAASSDSEKATPVAYIDYHDSSHTSGKCGKILAYSIVYLVGTSSAQMYYPALIWFWAKESGQERLMATSPVRQITPDSACRGLVQHAPPCTSAASKAVPRRWTVPPLMQIRGPHSEMIPGRLSQCGPEHSVPYDPCIRHTWEKPTQAWGSFV